MLIRQYSIRFLLKVTAICAVLSLFFHYAWAGETWAVGVVIALVALIVLFAVHSFAFMILWSVASSVESVSPTASPFASQSVSTPQTAKDASDTGGSSEMGIEPIQAEVVDPQEGSA